MAVDKFKVTDIAKDLLVEGKALKGKDIGEILAQYGKSAKSNTVGAEDMNLIFEHLTQKHQVSSLAEVFAPAAAAAENRKKESEQRLLEMAEQEEQKKKEAEQARLAAAEEAKKAAEKPAEPAVTPTAPEKPAEQSVPSDGSAGSAQPAAKETAAPHKKPPVKKQDPKKAKQPPAKARETKTVLQYTPKEASKSGTTEESPSSMAQKVHYVDTRGSNVNIAKYDERMETLVPKQADRMGQQNKQKLTKSNQKRPTYASNKRRQEEQEKMRRLERMAQIKKVPLKVLIPEEIAVGELALRMKKSAADVIKQLMKMGVMASVSQVIDYETASLVALELGTAPEKEVIVTIEEQLFDQSQDSDSDLEARAPVVVVMGHVDHGKTSLLDAIRKSNVASGEAGGITQHIGAYTVQAGGRQITFLDTPGHAAFTSMRARGAEVTDIAILVVAADDGIMPQTIEAINHAKAAEVPIVVAINKMDKEGANPEKIMQQLTEHELVSEEWGGSTIICPVSAKKGDGIDNLLEMVLLTADMLELKANPDRLASGVVIEAKLDKARGPVATILIQNGTLKSSDIVIAGTSVGRVRAMQNEHGTKLEVAGPSTPVEIIGLADVPGAGDMFYAVEDERMARTLAEQRRHTEKEERASALQKVTLENLFTHIEEGNMKELNIIIKADVKGSAEAVRSSLEKISNEEVVVRVIHAGVGGITSSDILLADVSNAIVVGFNVRPEAEAAVLAEQNSVDIRMYSVIYDCIEEIEQAVKGMLAPKFREAVIGHAEIRQTFKVSSVGTIAGCYVLDGKMQRNENVRIVRDNVVIHEGPLATLKRFKDDAKEVAQGYECGMSFENYNDIKTGDIVEAYVMEEVKR